MTRAWPPEVTLLGDWTPLALGILAGVLLVIGGAIYQAIRGPL